MLSWTTRGSGLHALLLEELPLRPQRNVRLMKGQEFSERIMRGYCDSDLFCWSWYAGRAGTSSDKTVVAHALLFYRTEDRRPCNPPPWWLYPERYHL